MKESRKIIFVIPSMTGGGAERVISLLANRFVDQGMEVSIMMTAGDEVVYGLNPRIRLLSMGGISGGSMKRRLQRIRRMRACFQKERDAVLIAFGPGTAFFTVAADLFLKHRMIISERNDPAACPHRFLRNLVYRQADRLVFQTEEARGCFPAGIQKKGRVIPNPVSAGLPLPWQGERRKVVAAVGRLEPQKNHRLLLEAFALFGTAYPEYRLEIYGQGSLEQTLRHRAEELGLGDRVAFQGFVRHVDRQIRDAGMYVLSSDYEGISNSLLEAMAMGIPSISTDCPIGGSRLCISSGKNGILVPLQDPEAMAEAMKYIAAKPEQAEAMARQAAGIREIWSEEGISRQWMACIDALCDR